MSTPSVVPRQSAHSRCSTAVLALSMWTALSGCQESPTLEAAAETAIQPPSAAVSLPAPTAEQAAQPEPAPPATPLANSTTDAPTATPAPTAAVRDPRQRFSRPVPTEAPLAPKVVRPTRKTTPVAGGLNEITFDAIKFDIDKGEAFERSMIPSSIEALLGQRIKIRGYILPSFQQQNIKQFVLVRDNMECCFGPGAALYDCIVVDMVPGRATEFTTRPIAVEGKFTINEVLGADGEHLAIFHLDGETAQ